MGVIQLHCDVLLLLSDFWKNYHVVAVQSHWLVDVQGVHQMDLLDDVGEVEDLQVWGLWAVCQRVCDVLVGQEEVVVWRNHHVGLLLHCEVLLLDEVWKSYHVVVVLFHRVVDVKAVDQMDLLDELMEVGL